MAKKKRKGPPTNPRRRPRFGSDQQHGSARLPLESNPLHESKQSSPLRQQYSNSADSRVH